MVYDGSILGAAPWLPMCRILGRLGGCRREVRSAFAAPQPTKARLCAGAGPGPRADALPGLHRPWGPLRGCRGTFLRLLCVFCKSLKNVPRRLRGQSGIVRLPGGWVKSGAFAGLCCSWCCPRGCWGMSSRLLPKYAKVSNVSLGASAGWSTVLGVRVIVECC